MPKKIITIVIDEDISEEFHEQLKGFVDDFYKQDAEKIFIGDLEDEKTD